MFSHEKTRKDTKEKNNSWVTKKSSEVIIELKAQEHLTKA